MSNRCGSESPCSLGVDAPKITNANLRGVYDNDIRPTVKVLHRIVEWHDDVMKWKHFLRYWPFVRGIHRSRWIPRTKASDAELWYFLDLRLNKRLSKQPWGWWFETPAWLSWRHRNGYIKFGFSLSHSPNHWYGVGSWKTCVSCV